VSACLTRPTHSDGFPAHNLCRKSHSAHLQRLPVGPLGLGDGLIAGVEAGEGREGVDPRAAGAREGPHQAGDAAQRGGGMGRQGGVRQQLRHQVPGLVDHRQVHAVAAHRPLQRTAGNHKLYGRVSVHMWGFLRGVLVMFGGKYPNTTTRSCKWILNKEPIPLQPYIVDKHTQPYTVNHNRAQTKKHIATHKHTATHNHTATHKHSIWTRTSRFKNIFYTSLYFIILSTSY